MDPIEHLRALRDESRWVPGEVELNAAPRPAPALAWRHWWPRITVATVVCAALAGLVIATLVGVGHTTDFAPGPASTDSSTPVVSPSPSPSTTFSVGETAACDSSGITPTLTQLDNAAGTFYADIVLTNSGQSPCAITALPGVAWVGSPQGAPAQPIGAPARPGDSSPQQSLIVQPGGSAHVRIGIADAGDFGPACVAVSPRGLDLTLHAPDGSSSDVYVSAEQETSLGVQACSAASVHQLTVWPASPTASAPGPTTPSGAAACTTAGLDATVFDPDAAAGGVWGIEIVLTNTSKQPCALIGYSRVAWVGDHNGTELGTPAAPDPSSGRSVATVVLQPGQAAYERVQVGAAENLGAGCKPATPDGFRVTLPGQNASLFAPFTRLPACTAPDSSQLTTWPIAATHSFSG